MSEKNIKKWWNEASKDYQKNNKIKTKSAHYGPYALNENKLKLLGSIKGKKILEIGCGGGQCSIAFAKKGAKCTGIDISKEQIKYAEKLAEKEKVNIKFICGSFQNLNKIKSNSYDIVFSAFALQYSPDLKKVFKEVKRVLKKKSIFVFSLDHPFSIPIYKKWNYYKPGKKIIKETWPDGSKHKFIGYSRKISNIINELIESGLILEKVIEPLELKKNDPWQKIYDKKLIKIIGPTIIFKARKK